MTNMKFRTFKTGGIHPEENKLSQTQPAVAADLPRQVVVPLSQHIGAPAVPVVRKGDRVRVGTLVAEAGGTVSARLHSSVSGTVAKIDNIIDACGYSRPAIVIDVEDDEWEPDIDRSDRLETLDAHPELTPERIVELVRAAGVAGMGGAGFPTAVKLTPPQGCVPECVIINAVECEPYITADHRLMLEHPKEILQGLLLLMMAARVERGYIAIEANKPDAIAIMNNVAPSDGKIKVVALKTRYPQGGEKQLVEAVTGRQVPPPPALPVSVGAIVQNVATAFAVYEAVMKRKPLVERYVTVSGKELARTSNLIVRLGTPVRQLIDSCGGLPVSDNKVLSGGPMMGKALTNIDSPVVKTTNAVTVMSGREARRRQPSPCIRCAKCVEACPMGLEPYLLAKLSSLSMWDRCEGEDIVSCIECGSCQYTCPSWRPLLDNIRLGKQKVMGLIRSRAHRQ